MNAIHPPARQPAPASSRFQFTLRHVALVFLLTALSMPLILWHWPFGLALFLTGLGLLLILVAILWRKWLPAIAGSILILPVLLLLRPVAVGQGRSTLACVFSVSDAATGAPLPGATVRIRDVSLPGYPEGVPVLPIPQGEPGVEGVTDPSGSATLTFTFQNSSKSGPLIDECFIYIAPYFWVQVDAPGYETALVRLDALVGTVGYDWNALPLPPMLIPLKPLQADSHER